jgi:ubiquinol-cytochrome c reductase iron-sulfur subunit
VSDESTVQPTAPLPVAALDDPHQLPYAKHPGRAQAVAVVAMIIGILGCIGFGITYWVSDQTQWQAVTLGVGLLGLGFGVTAWGKYLMARGPFVEERHPFNSSDEEVKEMTAAITQRGGIVVARRKLLGGLFAIGSLAFGVVAAFPLIRSLGPKPGRALFVTNWRRNSQLVTVDGGVLTVFPRGFAGSSPDQTILLRIEELGPEDPPLSLASPGRSDWTALGYVAYSKMCTHLGCPVGLYQEQTVELVCPCHQSIFNVLAGAVPEFGPAPRPLPQLPIKVQNGFLVAQDGYNQPIGPGFWERP